jgi:hypothetical protein
MWAAAPKEKKLVKAGWDSSVGIATDYGLDSWGSIPGRDKRFFSTPQHTDRPWGPSSFLGLFPLE